MVKNTQKLVSYGIRFNSINGISTVFSRLLRGLVIPKILGPLSFGLFGSIALFTRYLYLFDFGSSAYFYKEVAKTYHEKKSGEYNKLISETFTILVFGIFISGCVLFLISLLYDGENIDFYKIAILLTIPSYALTKIREYFMLFLSGTGQYKKFSVLKILENWVLLVFISLGIYFFGALGGVVAMLLSEVILMIAVINNVDLRPKIFFNFSVLKKVKLYVNQYFIQITEMVAVTADQVLLLVIFGPAGFGFYILGLSLAWIFEALSEVINNAFYPKIMKASVKNKEQSINILQLSLCMFLLTSVFFIPGSIVGINWLINVHFSDYESGLKIFGILLFFGISRGGLALLKRGFIASNKERLFILISILSMLISLIFAIIVYLNKISLELAVYYLSFINLFIYLIYYFFLTSSKHSYYYQNICLVIGAFLLLFLFQINIQDFYSINNPNIPLMITILLYLVPVSIAWLLRNRVADFLNDYVRKSNG